jgi:hypothetical protein
MKITDVLISAILKKGVLYEARNVDADFEIPGEQLAMTKEGGIFKTIKVNVKIDHMSIRVEKE